MSRPPHSDDTPPMVLFAGRHLHLLRTTSGWEYAHRPHARGIVAVLALTDDRRVLLTEQYRPPVRTRVIELPAGLAGDIPLMEDEPLVNAARRELREETGYTAREFTKLMSGPSSAGMSTEIITLFQATGLTKVGEGGGAGSENIRVHAVPVRELRAWCREREEEGLLVDFKVHAALQLALENAGGRRLWQ